MQRIDTSTAVATIPTPTSGGTPGYATNGNPATSQPATVLDADWVNSVQEELMAILAAAGTTPSKTTRNQVLTSLVGALFSRPEMASSLTNPGYQKLGPLIIQWGVSGAIAATTTADVNYPIAFPNAVLAGVATFSDGAGTTRAVATNWIQPAGGAALTKFQLRNPDSSAAQFRWIAIGY